MTKEQAKKDLITVRSLRNYYLGKNDLYKVSCPWCGGKVNCEDCLWPLLEDKYCTTDHGIAVCNLRSARNEVWVKESLIRLNRWEKKLLTIIKGIK